MSDAETHTGGCQCGAVRYRTTGQPDKAAVCHCRYCQLRTGSAFGVSVYFRDAAVTLERGELRSFTFQTESGRPFTNRFCPECGTSVFWTLGLFPGMTGIAGGTFDPPSFWYDVKREVFTRSKAPFVQLCIADSDETSSAYVPTCDDPAHRKGTA
jgi:hypothetical protein